ncbi:MAG: cobalamin B12-binding domain-containing protein [Elusimicrobia bacterium]|nr:cobalamin B12-binding domain-containing protein [Elusimicrobiota bacterium]
MKVLLLNPRNPDPPPVYFGAPYGLSLLGAILKTKGVEVLGRDYTRSSSEDMLADAEKIVRAEKPDLVGISCQSSNRGAAAALARLLKKTRPKLPLVVGGPFASTDPELVLRRTGADWVAVGDGEETLPELADALSRGQDPRQVAGLVWSEGGEVRRSAEREPFCDLDSLPDPDFDLFDAEAELARFRRPRAQDLAAPVGAAGRPCAAMHSAVMLLSSRGCVYRCVFCPMSTFKGKPRLLSAGLFVSQVARMARRYRWRDFVFGDNYFTRDRARVLEICAGLRREAPGIRWICMTRADAMDPALAREMAAAGCREVSYGVESGSAKVQKAIGKRLDLELVTAALAATREAGMQAVLMLMVGNPGDDLETTRETADFLRGLEPDRVQVHTTKVYPGTAIHAKAAAAGVIPPGFYDGDEHRPPLYTVERTAAQLAEMQVLLPSRTHYLEAGAGCVNGCCSLRKPVSKNKAVLASALAQTAFRAERGVLGGGESLLIPELDAVLDDADALQVFDLSLYTTARPLADARLVSRLRARKDTRRVVVPLLSPDASRHDARARVPGALTQTTVGLRRWVQSGGEVLAWLLPMPEDLPGLPAWTKRLAAEGVREAVLVHREPPPGWGGLPLEDTPRLRPFAAAAAEAALAAEDAGLAVSVFGLPPCLWDGALAPRHEDRALYDEAVSGAAAPVTTRSRRAPRQAFAPSCASCSRRASCDGVWADYLARHGEGELRAL